MLEAAGVGSSATGMKKPSSPPWDSLLPACIVEFRLFLYDVDGNPRPSRAPSDARSGDLDGLELPRDEPSFLYAGRGLGDSSVGVSESGSTRVSEKAFGGMALGGSAGRDLSVIMGEPSFSRAFACAAALDFFLRRAMRLS